MLLHVTLAAAPGRHLPDTPEHSNNRALVIKLTDNPTGRGVAALLKERYGQGLYTVRGTRVEDLTPGTAPLVNGAVILSSPTSAQGPPVGASGVGAATLLLAVCTGPDAGNIICLQRGTYTIGRLAAEAAGYGPRIGIADPALSRHHAQLVVGAESVTIRDSGSANGTWVDGRRIRTAAVDTGSIIRLGYSSCRLCIPGAHREDEATADNPFEPLTVRFAEQGQKTGLLLTGALLPLILGIVLALATGMWMFLAFSAVSAVTALIAAGGSRRRHREHAAGVAEAAREDGRRRRLAAPDPGATALAAELGHLPGGITGAPGVYPVRIGAGDQPANVAAVPAPPRFSPPQIPEAPVILALGKDRDICLEGSPQDTAAVGRTILLQAAAGSGLHTLCLGTASELELDARFLPGVRLAALPAASSSTVAAAAVRLRALLADLPAEAAEGPPALMLFIHRSWAEYAGQLLQGLPESQRAHTSIVRSGGPPAPVTVSLVAGRGTLVSGTHTLSFVPDLVQRRTFERLSRALAARPRPVPHPAQVDGPGKLPPAAAFEEFHAPSEEMLLNGWLHGSRGAVVGVAASGPVTLDLDKDGPHFLVAGTTGSGKSEFLRTFVGSLAASLPPTSFTVLLIDFKGGSGLGPLAALPHSVGLLTDFSAANVARALVSLRAEVRRREALLAGSGADNLSAYNSARSRKGGLPRLLVVVDEFRMLADEVPTALPELLRIAAIGRSLGLHLLLATQRPQGAITTDIRANLSTSIALRVQSAAESRDVINTDSAAAIPPDLPGRAFLSRGGRPPNAFQSLSTSLCGGTGESLLMELHEYLVSTGSGSATEATGDPDALKRMVSAIRAAADSGKYPAPFSPVQPPLPSALTTDLLTRSIADRPEPLSQGLVLGLLDEPEKQRRRLLDWHPGRDSHLALLGAARSGAPDSLGLVAAKHLTELPGRHIYVLDADGSLAWLTAADQTGAYVVPQDIRRAERVLAYLAAELLQRLTPTVSPTAPRATGVTGGTAPGMTLIITGWARWCAAFRSGRGMSGEDDLADLIRDGERADICVVLAGDREVLNARFFPLVPNRMFFPADASAETLLAWPRLPPMDRVRQRALVQGRCGTAEGLSAQLLVPEVPLHPEQWLALPTGTERPHRIESLPAFVLPEALGPPASADLLPVGVSGDELETAAVRIPSGSVYLVAGPRGSGRSSFLRQLQRSADPALECRLVSRPEEMDRAAAILDQAGNELSRFLVLVDDADFLPASFHQKLAELQSRGARLVLVAAPGHQLTMRVPLALQIRSAPRGALLRPEAPSDGDIFGIRIEPGTRRPPGRCYLVAGTEVLEAQAAYAPAG
ncbi:FtsK/SpoIIIE domain-containing protein [Arthrobacter sp. zg-Y826]|uniref:FtsK/SpoIIIE domain-containing protein n=1 Tax=Arthrobacter jinronghuae TaxID=2964609 RepID=UPI0021069330|nr:FtsK/SpoIIIE domain-containing protein [Arthrobacter jinronghuae]MCQ1955070.1 FtsK/SpoIIIE domain-containing protein [Arthrobacter jinronghuae]